jgi:low affinity Fe/Cu permease
MVFEFFAVGIIAFFLLLFTAITVWCGVVKPHGVMYEQSWWFAIFAAVTLITMLVIIEGLL